MEKYRKRNIFKPFWYIHVLYKSSIDTKYMTKYLIKGYEMGNTCKFIWLTYSFKYNVDVDICS